MVPANAGLLPDLHGPAVHLDGILIPPLVESSVAYVFVADGLFPLLQEVVHLFAGLVELRPDLVLLSPRRVLGLPAEHLQGRHAGTPRGTLRHALSLRGVHTVVQHHLHHGNRLFTSGGEAELRVVRRRDPIRCHVQRRRTIVVRPQHIRAAVEQLQADPGIASSQRRVQRGRLHPRLLGLNVCAEGEQGPHHLGGALPAGGVDHRSLRDRIDGIGVGVAVQQCQKGLRARWRLPRPHRRKDKGIRNGGAHPQEIPRERFIILASPKLGIQRFLLCVGLLLRHGSAVGPHGAHARPRKGPPWMRPELHNPMA
mmetsp:Transcript_20366/g.51918  ORF Transcript_20366/g.51918 Transcript_20366/m.51918 type:complete len:312 (-) Transcript_20366:3-938(-)